MDLRLPSWLICALAMLTSLDCASSQRSAQREVDASGHIAVERPGVDLAGLRAFLGIAEDLMAEREPTEQAWLALEKSPGYAALLREEFPKAHFRQAFRLAFRPSRQSELRASLQSRAIPYLAHYVHSRDQLELIRPMASGTNPADRELVRRAASAAEEYLPTPSRLRSPPPVAIVVFAPDGRGYDPIVVDALFMLEMNGVTLQRFLAHEFHHYYRNLMMPKLRPNCLCETDAQVLWALDQLQAEGVADQLSVRPDIEAGDPPPTHLDSYRAWMLETPSRLMHLQALVLEVDRSGGNVEYLKKRLREILPQSGHPNGYYMANVILDVFGKERLLAHVADPFAFIYDYQAAVKLDSARRGEYIFSNAFEDYLGKLQARVDACRGEGGAAHSG